MLWAICKHRNSIIFNSLKRNPIDIIEQAKHTYYYTILYNKNTDFGILGNIARKNQDFKRKKENVNTWSLPPFNWHK